jgi:hypothetical protein
MRRAARVLGAVLIAACGCDVSRTPAAAPVDAANSRSAPMATLSESERAALRAEVSAQVEPLAGRKEYAVTDAAFLDPLIDAAMAAGGSRADVVKAAGSALYHELQERDGLAHLEGLVARRYASPVVTRSGDGVVVDAGIPPGQLSMIRGRVFLWNSPVVKDFQWSGREAARLIAEAAAQHPDAKTVEAQVTIPTRDGVHTWRYVYDRGADRIRVYVPTWRDRIYHTAPLGGDLTAYIDGQKSLAYQDLDKEWKSW